MMNRQTKTSKGQAPLPRLKALADPTRLRLLRLLEREELTVKELTDLLGMTQSRVSSHLGVLKSAGLVRDRRQGTSSLYSLLKEEPAFETWKAVKPTLELTPADRKDQTQLKALLDRRRGRDREFFDRASVSWDLDRSESLGLHAGTACLAGLLENRLTVLEIGTGTGSLLPILARQIDHIIALDFSRGMLLRAQERMNRFPHPDVQFARGDVERLPLGTGTVDGAIMNMVLHHLPDPLSAFREVFRVLTPGGRAVVVDFEAHDERRLLEEENHRWPGFEPSRLSAWGLDAGFTLPTLSPIFTPRTARWSRLRVFAARFTKRQSGSASDAKLKQ